MKLSSFCGTSETNTLHTFAPYSYVGQLCVLLLYELRDQEARIVLQNLQAGHDIEYDKWDMLPTAELDDDVKDLWTSYSNSIFAFVHIRKSLCSLICFGHIFYQTN